MAVTFRSSSIRSVSDDNSGTVAIPVPSGASAGDIVVAYVGTWNSLSVVSPPSGFTLIAAIDSGGGSPTRVLVYWKRLTGSDAGTYDFTNALEWANGGAICLIGGLASGDPVVDFATGTAFSAAYPDLAVDADDGSGLAWVSYNENGDGTHDPPDGYTGIQAQDYGMAAWNIAAATGTHVATGATAGSTMQLAEILVAIAPEAAGAGSTIELNGALSAIEGAFDIDAASDVELAGALPALTGAFTVESTSDVELTGQLPSIESAFNVEAASDAELAGALPSVEGSFDVEAASSIALVGTLPSLTGAFDVDTGATAELAGTLPSVEGAFQVVDADQALIELTGTLPPLTGAFNSTAQSSTALNGTLPVLVGSFEIIETEPAEVVLVGALPALTGSFDIDSGSPLPGRPVQPFAAPRSINPIADPRGIMRDAPERPIRDDAGLRPIRPEAGLRPMQQQIG